MELSAELAAQRTVFKNYVVQFIDALRPIVEHATGSDKEIFLAKCYIQSKTAKNLLSTYQKRVEMDLNGRPVWHWIVKKNDKLLLDHPEVLLGVDDAKVQHFAKMWLTALDQEQKNVVYSWMVGMVNLAGFDFETVE